MSRYLAEATARLRFSLEGTIRSLSSALEQTLYISNLIEFFNEKPQMVSGSSMLPSPTRAEIELKNVSFTYPGSAEPVLRDISLHIRPGETVALVGENGAGQDDAGETFGAADDPDMGRIEFDGVDLRTLSLSHLRKQIGFVLQDFGRYEASAADNIAYGDWRLMSDSRPKVEEVARLAGVDTMVRSMPAGYDTVLGRVFGEHDLSGGQWQRLAIARAFARDASVLILDEPTASLSVQAEYDLFCRFHELFTRPNDDFGFSSLLDFEHCRSNFRDGKRTHRRIRHPPGVGRPGGKLRAAVPLASTPAKINGVPSEVRKDFPP